MSFLDIFLLGIIGGISPGPITALMLGETLKNGFKRGAQVPLALLLSNVVIGSMAVALLQFGKDISGFIALLTYTGAGVLILFGVQECLSKGELELKHSSHPFKKALFIDAFNPHPYIVWFTVLGPVLVKSGQSFSLGLLLFVAGLVGTKLVIILLAHHLRRFMTPSIIKWISRVLGLVLIYFGVSLLMN